MPHQQEKLGATQDAAPFDCISDHLRQVGVQRATTGPPAPEFSR